MHKQKYVLVAVTDRGAKQLATIKPEDHVRYMPESSAQAFNITLQCEGLLYIPLNEPCHDYYSGVEIAGEGYEEIKEMAHIDTLFDNLFMEA